MDTTNINIISNYVMGTTLNDIFTNEDIYIDALLHLLWITICLDIEKRWDVDNIPEMIQITQTV